ncbi:MAG: aminotransferase class V-fold PLP-dependent enzyme [Gemmatimonadales bacterium]
MTRPSTESYAISRRRLAGMLIAGGAAVLSAPGGLVTAAEPPAPQYRLRRRQYDESFWHEVREQFVIRHGLAPFNAANLCPSPAPVLDRLHELTRDIDSDPSPFNRAKLTEARERTRTLLAQYFRVSPEEIVITRNTSEANNMVSSGLDLGSGDEVIIFSENHPSNNAAWKRKADRFGFAVETVEVAKPHPGPEYYLETLAERITDRTKVIAFTHVTNTVGDLFPAAEICALARERGVMSLVDGAQSFGVLDVNLADMKPDFFTGSAHKWPCGPKETGVLYVNREVWDRVSPSVVSLYAGRVGISQELEAMGQRDTPAMAALGTAIEFQLHLGQAKIEARARELMQALVEGLRAVDGITLWTDPRPERSAAVLSFKPADLDPLRLAAALYENDQIVCAVRAGDRPGVRLSPHLYNLHEEVERTVAAIRRYIEREG